MENVSEFLDSVEVDSAIDDMGVDHSVSIPFEKGPDVHHFVLVITKLSAIAYLFCLELSFEGSVGLAIAGESV